MVTGTIEFYDFPFRGVGLNHQPAMGSMDHLAGEFMMIYRWFFSFSPWAIHVVTWGIRSREYFFGGGGGPNEQIQMIGDLTCLTIICRGKKTIKQMRIPLINDGR